MDATIVLIFIASFVLGVFAGSFFVLMLPAIQAVMLERGDKARFKQLCAEYGFNEAKRLIYIEREESISATNIIDALLNY